MGRPKGPSKKIPAYCIHKGKQKAYATIDGKPVYFQGAAGSAESRAEYQQIIGRWLMRGRVDTGSAPVAGMTMTELLAGFVQHMLDYYQGRRQDQFVAAIKHLRRLHSNTPAVEFDSLALEALRMNLMRTVRGWRHDKGVTLCRNYINQLTRKIQRIFKWGAKQKLIPWSVYHELTTVEPLLPGFSKVRETKPVMSAPLADVEAAMKFMTPPVRAMVIIQMQSGARSSEAAIMRGIDIDMKGDVWFYRPEFHKTSRLGKERVIALNEKAKDAIRPFLRPNLHEYIFRPEDGWAARNLPPQTKKERPIKERPIKEPRELSNRYFPDCYRQIVKASWLKLIASRPDMVRWTPSNPIDAAVPAADFDAIAAGVSAQVRTMMRIQRATGMDQHDVCKLTRGQVDDKLMKLCGDVLAPFLDRKPARFLFTPGEAYAARRLRVGKSIPRKRGVQRFSDRYSAVSYWHAVQTACKRAGVKRWHPHRLRHSFAGNVAATGTLDDARLLCNHSSISTTMGYVDADLKRMARVVSNLGRYDDDQSPQPGLSIRPG